MREREAQQALITTFLLSGNVYRQHSSEGREQVTNKKTNSKQCICKCGKSSEGNRQRERVTEEVLITWILALRRGH